MSACETKFKELKLPGQRADLFYVSSLPDPQAIYRPAALAALMRDFDREPVASRQRIRDILQCQPEVFYRMAIEVLRDGVPSRASQYLVGLLVSGGLLFRALCDPELSREQASELARFAQAGDPAVDVQLSGQLAHATRVESDLAPGTAERLLEIIGQISNRMHRLPSFMRMLRNGNPYLRSKVVLLIGRSGRSLKWIKKRLQESDARVRANAIEAAWGIDTPEARELLAWAARDLNNRVAGNALLGMYRLGEGSSLAELSKMASHDSAAFRRTAAWAMGETGDSRFTEVLGRMIGDAHTGVRKVAFAAMRRVREATAYGSQLPQWQMAAAAGPTDQRTGERKVSVAVAAADGHENPRVLPAQFLLTENGQVVWSYRVAERMAAGPMAVLFLFPRSPDKRWDDATRRCLTWKRSTDLWSTVTYSGADDKAADSMNLELPGFIASSAESARALEQTSRQTDCTGFWTAIKQAILPGSNAVRGPTHMIVLAPEGVGGSADDDLIAAVRASRTAVQLISAAENPVLREFCRRVYGHFQHVKDGAGIEEAISSAYLIVLARYEIRYQPVVADAATLKIRVQAPAGWGETTVEF
jgi:hypothetical protein